MKIILLDIDGVLVTSNNLLDLQAQGKRMTDSQGRHLFDPKCVANLKRILDATDAKIVLSSCWKMFGFDVFTAMWKDRNVPGDIIDFTPSKLSATRGQEIDIWLRDNKDTVDSFVIIDDDVSDMMRDQVDFIVRTTWDDGLTDSLADDAIKILNTK